MKKIIKNASLISGSIVFNFLGLLGLSQSVDASTEGLLPPGVTPPPEMVNSIDPGAVITKGMKYLMYAVGVVSVVMIIIGGIRYATSGGNAEKVKTAKNTILYACVGLAVALLALAIVGFVSGQVKGL